MTPEQRAALDALVPAERRSADDEANLLAAAIEAERRRTENSREGGVVIAALHALGWSWRGIEAATGIPQGTARRWAEPGGAQ